MENLEKHLIQTIIKNTEEVKTEKEAKNFFLKMNITERQRLLKKSFINNKDG